MGKSKYHSNDLVGMENEKLSNVDVCKKRPISVQSQTANVSRTSPTSSGNPNETRHSREHSTSDSHQTIQTSSICNPITEIPCTEHDNMGKNLGTYRNSIRRRKDEACVRLEFSNSSWIEQICELWDRFFHARTDATWGGILRIMYASVALMNTGLLLLDLDLFFVRLVPLELSQRTMLKERWTPLIAPKYYDLVATLWMIQLFGLLVGIVPRFNAIGNFFWTVAFHHHNNLLFTGADIVIRLMGFFVIFLPLHRCTIWDSFRSKSEGKQPQIVDTWPLWPFRLIQLEMCFIYISSVIIKWNSSYWWEGTALYYVVHDDFHFGKQPFSPKLLFGYHGVLQLMTWSSLILETVAPIFLWIPTLRRPTLFAVVLFHIGIELSMSLNFFHPIMIVGWWSFFVQPVGEKMAESKNIAKQIASEPIEVSHEKKRA